MSRYLVAHVASDYGLGYAPLVIDAEDEREAAEQYLSNRNADSGTVYVVETTADPVIRFQLDVTTQTELRRITPE